MTRTQHWRLRIAVAAAAVAALTGCAHGRDVKATPDTGSATSVALPAAQTQPGTTSAAVQCGNKVRMAVVMTATSRPGVAIRTFAASGTTAVERRVFQSARARFARVARAAGATAAAGSPVLSLPRLIRACSGSSK